MDAANDAAADSGLPCVDNVSINASLLTIIADYTTSKTDASVTGIGIPYYCHTQNDALFCKDALVQKGAVSSADQPGWYMYTPPTGVCHVDVPTYCLPCTGATTQW